MRNDEELKEIYNYIKILLVIMVSGFLSIAGILGYIFGKILN